VRKQTHVHVDETLGSSKASKEWLWVAANNLFCVFYAGDTRSRAELENVGERFQGIISSDDVLSVYNGYPWLLSKVFSHLRRHVQKLIKFGRGVSNYRGSVSRTDRRSLCPVSSLAETADTAHYQLWANAFKVRVQLAAIPASWYDRCRQNPPLLAR